MADTVEFWLVGVVLLTVLVALGIVGVSSVLERRSKARRMAAFAHHHRWHYTPENHQLVSRFPGSPLCQGFGKRAVHVVNGRHRGAPFTAFEFRFAGRGHSETNRFTVVVLTLPAVRPWLEVTVESALTRSFSRRNLRLESEEFNEAFHVMTDSERFAYDVLTPTTMAWLLTDPRARSYPFRFTDDYVLGWCETLVEPGVVLGLLDYLSDLRDRVPAFVWSDPHRFPSGRNRAARTGVELPE